MDYDHIKIKISCEMKNGYVWEIRTRIFFYIALCIALVFMMQHSVTWKLPDFIELLLKYIVLLLSLIRFMAVLPLYTKKEVLFILFFFPIIGLIGVKTGNLNYVFLPFIFGLIAKGLYLKDIIKCYFVFCWILIVGTFLCCHMGLLENMVSFREEKVRNSFGFIYATDFAAHIFYLVLMYFYLRSGKFNLIEIMLFLYSSFFIANQCDARLDSICIIMIVFFSIYINLTKGRDYYFSGYCCYSYVDGSSEQYVQTSDAESRHPSAICLPRIRPGLRRFSGRLPYLYSMPYSLSSCDCR